MADFTPPLRPRASPTGIRCTAARQPGRALSARFRITFLAGMPVISSAAWFQKRTTPLGSSRSTPSATCSRTRSAIARCCCATRVRASSGASRYAITMTAARTSRPIAKIRLRIDEAACSTALFGASNASRVPLDGGCATARNCSPPIVTVLVSVPIPLVAADIGIDAATTRSPRTAAAISSVPTSRPAFSAMCASVGRFSVTSAAIRPDDPRTGLDYDRAPNGGRTAGRPPVADEELHVRVRAPELHERLVIAIPQRALHPPLGRQLDGGELGVVDHPGVLARGGTERSFEARVGLVALVRGGVVAECPGGGAEWQDQQQQRTGEPQPQSQRARRIVGAVDPNRCSRLAQTVSFRSRPGARAMRMRGLEPPRGSSSDGARWTLVAGRVS